MGLYIDRDGEGRIVGRFPERQREDQEYLADGSDEMVAIELADARVAKTSAAGVVFGTKIVAGVIHDGRIVQIRAEDRANISGQSARAIAALIPGSGVAWPSDFAWRAADNSFIALPEAADMLALGAAASDRLAALRLRLWQLKDAIDAAPDQSALDEIDVMAGWD